MEGIRKRGSGRLRLAGILAAALLAAGVVTASAVAVVGGQPDNGAHPYVGMVAFLYQTPDGVGAELCSGSLVSATVFVTAAHCVPPESLQVATRVTFVENGAFAPGPSGALVTGPYVVGHATVDPQFCAGCAPGLPGFDTHDLAVVEIDPASIPHYPGYPTTYAQLPALGQADTLSNKAMVDIVGYGLPAIGNRTTAPARVIPGGGKLGDQFLKLSSNGSKGKGATCSGDSGGPDLLQGTSTIIAISGFGPNTSCKAVEYSQRLDTQDSLAFIGGFLP